MAPATSASLVALAIATSLVSTLLSSSPPADEIAAVFPPWWAPARVIETAADAGAIVGLGSWRAVVVVRSDAADLAGRLRRSGALITLDAGIFAGCTSSAAGRLP